jgi:hypothetical protein
MEYEALDAHWRASAVGDLNAEHEIYNDDVICDYPQSGERIVGRNNLQALRSHHPGKPSGFNVKRIVGGSPAMVFPLGGKGPVISCFNHLAHIQQMI